MATTLIKSGRVFTGNANQKAVIQDILIQNKKIVQISENITANNGTHIIDAAGKWVVPGFIDCHTHYDGELLASPGIEESARHGVTTIMLGSCSISAIYNNAEDTADCFTRVEAVPREHLLPILQRIKTWENPAEWKTHIEGLPLGVNVASFIGHSDIRSRVMGIERSLSHQETATKAEQHRMNDLLNESLDAGFIGLSTMDNPWDKMDGERYWSHKTPSFYGSWKERRILLNTLRERGAVLQGAPNLVTRINALRYMYESTGVFKKPLKTTLITLIDLIADRWICPLVAFGGQVINRMLGADFRMQSLPVPFTVYYDGVDSVMFEEFPSGEAMRHLAKNLEERNTMIKDAAFRKTFKGEIKKRFAPKVWHRDLGMAFIIECPDKSLIGKNFYEISEMQNKHPVDTFLDLIVEYDKQIRWTTTLANDREQQFKWLYNYPFSVIGFSDAGAHLNNMAFYNFPLKMIKNVYYSIQNNTPIMSMEKCIWRLTGEHADWFGLDCGYIAEGKTADLNILNPNHFDNITENVEMAQMKGFGNYMRLVNRNEGVVSQVMVGGEVIFENEEFVAGFGESKKYGRFLAHQN